MTTCRARPRSPEQPASSCIAGPTEPWLAWPSPPSPPGSAQFGVVAALGDVAKGFGQVTHGATFADQAGLSGTDLGIGLAVIRLAALGGLPGRSAWPTASAAGGCC